MQISGEGWERHLGRGWPEPDAFPPAWPVRLAAFLLRTRALLFFVHRKMTVA